MTTEQVDPLWVPVYFNEVDAEAFAADKLRGPCPRNREIFHEIRVRNRSQREVARQFNLSHTRIAQIVRQVERWIAKTDDDREGSRRDRLLVAESVHQARLNQLFKLTVDGFEKSNLETRRSKLVVTSGKPDRSESGLVTRSPDHRLALAALKVQQAIFEFARDRAERPPAEEMTREERIAELREIAAAAGEREVTQDQVTIANEEVVVAEVAVPMPNDQPPPVEQVCNLLAAEVEPGEEVAHEIATEPELVEAESVPNTSRLQTCSTDSPPAPPQRIPQSMAALAPRMWIRPAKPPEPPPTRKFYYDGEFIPPEPDPPQTPTPPWMRYIPAGQTRPPRGRRPG